MSVTAGNADTATIRPATRADRDFILGLVERFSAFPLPAGRDREGVNAGVRADITRHLDERPHGSHFFIVEVDDGHDRTRNPEPDQVRAGFIHLLLGNDFFDATPICHISDLAVSTAFEGRGLARRMLAHAEAFARDHACSRLTLSVLPGNARARSLYEANGFGDDLLRMARPLD